MGAAKIGQAHKQSGACARIHVRIGIVKQQTDAVSGVSGCASAPAHGDVSWRAKAGRAGKRGARFAAQLALVVAVYGAGCAIASVLPVRLPGNIVGMVLLLVLLGTGLLKARHVGDACDCLLDNMSLFFIPAGVAIMGCVSLLEGNALKFALVCVITTVIVFLATSYTVMLVSRLTAKRVDATGVAFIIAALVALRIPLDSYEQSVQLISFLLGPATVALAYSVYRQRQTLKEHFVPIFAGCLVGSVVSMASAYALCKLLGLDDALALSFIPKSVTTPIAIAVSQQLGGITSITVAAVIVTGILGAITAPLMARLFRVRDGIAKGVAIGTCSHAVGTTKALEMGELEGAMSGVSIAVSGLLTTAIVIVASCFL